MTALLVLTAIFAACGWFGAAIKTSEVTRLQDKLRESAKDSLRLAGQVEVQRQAIEDLATKCVRLMFGPHTHVEFIDTTDVHNARTPDDLMRGQS